MTPLVHAVDPSRALAVPPPGAGSAETLDILVGLFILLFAAKVGEELFRRLGQPGVVGELAGGFVVGPYALGLVVPGETALVLSEIGVVILLFAVGLEIKTDELFQVGRPAAVTAILGVIFPIAAGVGYAMLTGEPPATAAFVGLALAATSIGITSRVLADLGVLDRRFSRIIIGAAVIDDILALILIGIVSGRRHGRPRARHARPRRGSARFRRPRLRHRPAGPRPAVARSSRGRCSPTRRWCPSSWSCWGSRSSPRSSGSRRSSGRSWPA